MTVEFPQTGRFEFGRVVSRTFGAFGANLGVFLMLGVLLSVLPDVGLAWLRHTLGWTTASEQNLTNLPSNLLGIVLNGALISGSLAHFTGKRVGFAECLSQGFRNFAGLFGVGLLTGLGILGGLLLFIVPGLIWFTAWSVSGPAWVAEGRGVTQAIGRSLRLTRGHRWPIFGLILIVMVSFVLLALVGGGLSYVIHALAPQTWGPDMLVDVILSPILTMILMIVFAVGATAIYVELPGTKTGAVADSVAATFD